MNPLLGLLLLLCVPAAAEDVIDPRTLLLGDVPMAGASRSELFAAAGSRDTLTSLQAWTALRVQNVQPEADEAWVVRGVAVERDGKTLAVYEDGSVRWTGEGELGSPSREIARLAKTMMTAAESAMKTTRPMPHADTSALGKDRVRMTVMTYGGYSVIEAHESALNAEHPLSEPLAAAREILRLLPN